MDLPLSPASPPPGPRSRRRRIRNALLVSIVSLLVSLLVCELAIRVLLFLPGLPLGEFANSLRKAEHFASSINQDDY